MFSNALLLTNEEQMDMYCNTSTDLHDVWDLNKTACVSNLLMILFAYLQFCPLWLVHMYRTLLTEYSCGDPKSLSLLICIHSRSLTVVFSMWSCSESMSRSPTGCQRPLTSSGRLRCTSNWSMALCKSWSFSRERSTCSCQPPTCPSSLSQRSRTSAACFRIALATRWAFSSGDNSKRRGK